MIPHLPPYAWKKGCIPKESYFIRDKLTGRYVRMFAFPYVIWADSVCYAWEYPSKGIALRESVQAQTYLRPGPKRVRVKADIEVVQLTEELLYPQETS